MKGNKSNSFVWQPTQTRHGEDHIELRNTGTICYFWICDLTSWMLLNFSVFLFQSNCDGFCPTSCVKSFGPEDRGELQL